MIHMILNNEEFFYVSYNFRSGDYKTKRLIIEVEYYVEIDGKKVEGNISEGLKTTQGFIVEKIENCKIYIKTTENTNK